jgi:hypothetical protein
MDHEGGDRQELHEQQRSAGDEEMSGVARHHGERRIVAIETTPYEHGRRSQRGDRAHQADQHLVHEACDPDEDDYGQQDGGGHPHSDAKHVIPSSSFAFGLLALAGRG